MTGDVKCGADRGSQVAADANKAAESKAAGPRAYLVTRRHRFGGWIMQTKLETQLCGARLLDTWTCVRRVQC
eukprot:562262-Rhodomonas_salina.1